MSFVASSMNGTNGIRTLTEIQYSLPCTYNLTELFRYKRGEKCTDI